MLGDKLKSLRKKANLSQEELADQLGVTRQSISLWENDQSSPSIENIIAISRIFEISIDELVDNRNSDEKTDNLKEDKPADNTQEKKMNLTKIIVAVSAVVVALAAIVVVVLLLMNRLPANDSISEETYDTSTQSTTDKAMGLTSEEIYNIAVQSTVEIHIITDEGKITGTGFCDDNNGSIITNYHVITGGIEGYVKDYYGTKYDIVSVIGYDEDKDIAILKTDFICDTVLPKRETALKVGEDVYALGSSQGLTGTFSSGIISALDRSIDGNSYIQTTAPISNGNSGGPLIDKSGNVVGINCGGLSDGQNLNFAIDIKDVAKVSRDKYYTLFQIYNRSIPNKPDFEDINTFIGIPDGEYAGTVHLHSCDLVKSYYEKWKREDYEGYVTFGLIKEAVDCGYQKCDSCHCADEYWERYNQKYN